MSIRIREPRQLRPGETVTVFLWKNPKPPKPIRDPAQKYVKRQKQLDDDPARFKSACQFAGLTSMSL
jgi:hypothetical protein